MENSHDLVIPAMVNPANNNNNAQDQESDDASNNITNNARHNSMRNISDDNMALMIQHRSGHGNHGANGNSSENMMNHTMNHHSSGTDNSSWYWQSMLNMMQHHSHMSSNLKIDHGLTIDHHVSNNDVLQGSVADINGACIHPLGGATASPDTGAMWSQDFL